MIYDLQKADMWKRISAFIFDMILLFILSVGLAFLLSLATSFDGYIEKYEARSNHWSAEYGTDLSISEDEYNELSEEDKQSFDKAVEALSKDGEANYATYMMFNLSLIIVIFGVLLAYIVLEFIIPLLFKNGQTLGKKIFGIAVMRIDGVKISAPILFVRSILGKYTIETMIPLLTLIGIGFGIVGFMGPVIILIVVLSSIIMMIATKTNSPIHDMLANTVAVDVTSQLIFDTPEALLAYKQKVHAEMAEKADY